MPDTMLFQAALSHLDLALANIVEQARCHEVKGDYQVAILAAADKLQLIATPRVLDEKEEASSIIAFQQEMSNQDAFHMEGSMSDQQNVLLQELEDMTTHEQLAIGPSEITLNSQRQEEQKQDVKVPACNCSETGTLIDSTCEETGSQISSPPLRARDPYAEMMIIMMDAFNELDTHCVSKVGQGRLKIMTVHLGFHTHHIHTVFSGLERTHDGLIYQEEWQSIAKQVLSLHTPEKVTELVRRARARRTGAVESQTLAKMLTRRAMSNKFASQRFLISYKSKWRMIWDIFILILLLYVALTLPLAFAFRGLTLIRTMDQVVDWLFVCDVVLNFRTSYMNEQREEIWEPMKIAKRYLKSWFLLDFVSSIPLEQLTAGVFPRLQPAKLLKFGKITKVFKILRIGKMFKLWAGSEIMDHWEEIVWSNHLHALSRFIQLIAQLLVVGHWLACLLLACGGGKTADEYFQEDVKDVKKYLLALYWAIMTMTTVGYGDVPITTDTERVYAIAAMIVGANCYGYIIGSVTTILSERDMNTRAFTERMEIVVGWLNTHYELPYAMRRRIWRHFKEFLTAKKAIEDSIILNDLPPQLRGEVAGVLLKDCVRTNQLFEGLSIKALTKLVNVMSEVKFQADETVVSNGDAGKSMFIINRGFVHLKKDGRTRQLCAGGSFGEEMLMTETKVYQYQVWTHSRVSMYRILRDEFLTQFSELPQDMVIMNHNYSQLARQDSEANVVQSVPGFSSLIAGGSAGVPPSFPDAVLDRMADLMRRMDHLQSNNVDGCEDASTMAPSSRGADEDTNSPERQRHLERQQTESTEDVPRLSKLKSPSSIWLKKPETLSTTSSQPAIL